MVAAETLKGKHDGSLLGHLEIAASVVPVLLPVRLQLVMMLVFPDNFLWN